MLEKKHPLAIRWFHWVNFPLLLMMLWSGLLIYWANPVYRLELGSYTLFHFFPEAWFVALGVPYRLAEGMSLHFFFMWLFAANGLLYVVYLVASGEWRQLVHVARGRRKFNGAQQIAYTAVILMGAASLATGLAIYKPVQFAWLTDLLGGYEWARWEHFWLAIGYVLFLVIHVVQVARAGWNNFRAMVTGYEIVS